MYNNNLNKFFGYLQKNNKYGRRINVPCLCIISPKIDFLYITSCQFLYYIH